MSRAARLFRRHGPSPAAVPVRRHEVVAWDLPTRLFKWSLVVLVIGAWIGSGLDDPAMTVHKLCGYGVLVAVVFRVLWGFFGSSTARFRGFVRSPEETLAYLRAVRSGSARPYLGHNPAGGLMILGLLAVVAIQVGLGLFATDGVLAAGPFAGAIGDLWAARVATLHALWFYAILGLATLHIAVNLYTQFVKRENLIGAMITGRKPAGTYADGVRPVDASWIDALICLGIAVGAVYLGVILAGGRFFGDG